MNIRQEIERALKGVLQGKNPKEQALNELLALGMPSSAATVTQLFYGSLRFYHAFSQQLNQLCSSGLPTNLERFLIMALYQFRYMDSMPDYAVMNETISLIQKKSPHQKKFCTWLLHEWLRHERSGAERLNFQIFPVWFSQLLQNHLPLSWLDSFTERFLSAPRNYWFVPEQRRECFSQYAISDRVPVYESADSPEARQRRIESSGGVVCDLYSILLPYYFSSIDEGSFLDIGAAPGNKLIVARRRFPFLRFVAIEKNLNRLELLKKRLSLACGFQGLELVAADASSWLSENNRSFHRILLDAPCSALGTVLSNPEFLILKKATDFNAKQDIQKQLLSNALNRLEKGGELIYSVCSFLKAETDDVLAACLSPNYEIMPLDNLLGEVQFQQEYGSLLGVSPKLGNQIFYVSKIMRVQ